MPAEFAVGIGGQCPVQGFGTLELGEFSRVLGATELHLYFRARGERWSCEIGRGVDRWGCPTEVVWEAWGQWGVWPDAGWMTNQVAEHLVVLLVQAFQHDAPGGEWPRDLLYGDGAVTSIEEVAGPDWRRKLEQLLGATV